MQLSSFALVAALVAAAAVDASRMSPRQPLRTSQYGQQQQQHPGAYGQQNQFNAQFPGGYGGQPNQLNRSPPGSYSPPQARYNAQQSGGYGSPQGSNLRQSGGYGNQYDDMASADPYGNQGSPVMDKQAKKQQKTQAKHAKAQTKLEALRQQHEASGMMDPKLQGKIDKAQNKVNSHAAKLGLDQGNDQGYDDQSGGYDDASGGNGGW